MYSGVLEYVQQASSYLFYTAILLVCAQIIACDTEWRAVNRNQSRLHILVIDGACGVSI